MQTTVPRLALRVIGALAAASLACAGAAVAQTAAPQPSTARPLAAPVDPTFSAWSLAQLCQQQDGAARGECYGAVRGIIHGYQYGVLFLAQQTAPPAGEMQRISLCLRDVPVATIVQEFITDANQVSPDALKQTPAEVALLGSVHSRHACT